MLWTKLALLLMASLAHFSPVLAGYEHSCTADDYYGRRGRQMSACGTRLTDKIIGTCNSIGSSIWLGQRHKRGVWGAYRRIPVSVPRRFSVKRAEANSILRIRKRPMGTPGLVCECCVNRCSPAEMRQYCSGSNTRRKRGIDTDDKMTLFTEEGLNEFYEELDNMEADEYERMTVAELEQQPILRLLEKQKEINIRKGTSLKRGSAADGIGQSDSTPMQQYLKTKMDDLEAKVTQPDDDDSTSKLTDQEKFLLEKLRRLFETEFRDEWQ